MKSAVLVAEDVALLRHLREALLTVAPAVRWQSDLGIQAEDAQGRLFSMYDEYEDALMWEVQDGPHIFRFASDPPDMQKVRAVYIECRWEDLFIDLVGKMARHLSFPLWVLDGDGNVWRADSIDPERLVL